MKLANASPWLILLCCLAFWLLSEATVTPLAVEVERTEPRERDDARLHG